MKIKFLVLMILVLGAGTAFGQRGGKAEPNEIPFTAGSNTATLTGSLANHQSAEYKFTGKAGQTVYLKCGTEFDFRLNLPDTDFDTEWNKGSDNFELPEDGEYILSVRKRLTGVRRARFVLTITVK